MNPLRERLRSESPALYAALERSWEVAFEEWLSAVNLNNDSFNSYPHIRNLENYLDKLMVAWKRCHSTSSEPFSPLETYVLLVSILLHDIGRTKVSNGHGKESRKLVIGNWPLLGIPSEELALTIGKICEFHDEAPLSAQSQLPSLSTVVIDPYGTIRERELAATLTLLDHMDASFRRTVADFIKPEKDTVGAFRKRIRGVDIDLEGGLVKVVLGDGWGVSEPSGLSAEFSFDRDAVSEAKLRLAPPDFMQAVSQTSPSKPRLIISDNLIRTWSTSRHDAQGSDPGILTVFKGSNISSRPFLSSTEYLLQNSLLRVNLKSANLPPPPPPPLPLPRDRLLLAVILGDTRANCEALAPIVDVLSSLGMPLRGWCVEYREHIYNWKGFETFEPSLSKAMLKRTLYAAWGLSTQIFAAGELAYGTLAAELREPNVNRVKMAMRRLRILSDESPLWLSEDGWRWMVASGNSHGERHRKGRIRCRDLENKIDALELSILEEIP
jgi:hypothetical protein